MMPEQEGSTPPVAAIQAQLVQFWIGTPHHVLRLTAPPLRFPMHRVGTPLPYIRFVGRSVGNRTRVAASADRTCLVAQGGLLRRLGCCRAFVKWRPANSLVQTTVLFVVGCLRPATLSDDAIRGEGRLRIDWCGLV